MKSGSGTIQRAQQTDAALREKVAQLQHGKSGLLAAQRKIDVLTTERARPWRNWITPARRSAGGAKPFLHRDYRAGRRHRRRAHLRVGQFVQAGTQLMAVVPLDAVYVVANFKETQLTHVRNGQPGRNPDRQFPWHKA